MPTSSDLVQSGLVADYQFLEGTGTTVADTSGTSAAAVFSTGADAPTWVSGKGVQINGNDSYLTTTVSNATANSIMALIKMPPYNSSSMPGFICVVGSDGSGTFQRWVTVQNQPLQTNSAQHHYYNPWTWANAGDNTAEGGLCAGAVGVLGWVEQNSAAGYDNYWVNGQKWTTATDSTASNRTGNVWLGGSPTGYGFTGGILMRVCIYNRNLSDAEMTANNAAFQTFASTTKGVTQNNYYQQTTQNELAFEGDSITYGYDGNPSNSTHKLTTPWPQALTLANDTYQRDNFGIYGQLLQKMDASGYNKISNVYTPGASKNIICVFGGTNDLNVTAPSTVFGYLTDLVSKYVTQGWRVIVIPSLSNSVHADSLKNTFNNLIAAYNWGPHVQVIPTNTGLSVMYADGASTNTTYFSDGTHPTQTGANLIASTVAPYVNNAYITFTVSPSTAINGTPLTVTATGTGTSWVSGTTTFSVSGGTGASISGLTIASATSATFTLNPGTAAGLLTISDSTDLSTAIVTAAAGVPSFAVSPTTATVGTNLTVNVTGTNTSWVSGTTTFSVTGGTGASISGLTIASGTSASFTLNPGSGAGTLVIHDTADSATASITVAAAPSFTVSPSTATNGTPLTITATGTNTSWVSGTTTFSVTGGTGASISGLSITGQVATFTLNPGTAAGTLVIHDTTDSATASITASSAPVKSFTVSPTTATAGTNLTVNVTGTNTTWNGSTTFSVAGGSSPSISGLTVASATSASFTLNPGSAAGTLTITDSVDSASASITVASAPVKSFTVSPTTATAGTSLTITATGTNTTWNGSTTFSVAGGTGASISGLSISGQVATFTLNPGSSAGTLTISDNADSATSSVTVAAQSGGSGSYPTVQQIAAAVVAAMASSPVGSVAAPVELDLTQAVPNSNTSGTVGDSLLAARADGFGKITIVGSTLTLFAPDNVTVVKSFTLDNPSAPTVRF